MNVLYLVALGPVVEAMLDAVEMCLWQEFGFEIRRLPQAEDPGFAYDPKRSQYSSELILRKLQTTVPREGRALLAVTERDMFIPMLTFVFGHAQFSGRVGVISLARLHQEFYSLPPDPPLLAARAMKEAVHEVGHILGLSHCEDISCPMSLSNGIRQVDRKQENLCKNCSIVLEERLHRLSQKDKQQ